MHPAAPPCRDVVTGELNCDFFATLAWRDDRVNATADFDPASMWHPTVEFINAGDGEVRFTYDSHAVQVGAPLWVPASERTGDPLNNGTYVVVSARKQGAFAVPIRIEDFPYDTQVAQARGTRSVAGGKGEWGWALVHCFCGVVRAQIEMETDLDNDTMVWAPMPNIDSGIIPPGRRVEGYDIVGAWSRREGVSYPTSADAYGACIVRRSPSRDTMHAHGRWYAAALSPPRPRCATRDPMTACRPSVPVPAPEAAEWVLHQPRGGQRGAAGHHG
jgi:hypothetical protein